MNQYITTELLCWGIIALLGVVVYFVKKIMDNTDKLDKNVYALNKDVFGLSKDVSGLSKDVSGLSMDVSTFNKDFSESKTRFELLWEKSLSIEKEVKAHDCDINFLKGKRYAGSNSPLQLNEEGNKVLKESKINNIIDDREDELIKKIRETNPETFYDVHLTAQSILDNLIKENHSILLTVKNGAYNSGVDIDIVVFVGSLYLRDKYIAKYPDNK